MNRTKLLALGVVVGALALGIWGLGAFESSDRALLDAQIRHAIGLQRLIAGQAARRVAQWHEELNAIAARRAPTSPA